MRRFLVLAVAGGLVFVAPSMARADAQAAQGYLKEAQDLIEQNELQDAAAKLELAEAELDDATPAEKGPLQASIDAAKQKDHAALRRRGQAEVPAQAQERDGRGRAVDR